MSKTTPSNPYYVYVIQSLEKRPNGRPGFYYVGMTTDPVRRLKEHNGHLSGGGKYTAKHRPWEARALWGPYETRSDALKAEYALKHSKRGVKRTQWAPEDSHWCRGLGVNDPWVQGTQQDVGRTSEHDSTDDV